MFLGKDHFVWWIGVVEGNLDPALLGRVQVRIFGYHSSKDSNEIPTEDLPWAPSLFASNVHGAYGRPNVGDWVVGFFLDGPDAQEPIVMGIMPGNVESNLGPTGNKWSTESERSFPSVYYSVTNQTNRNDYIHEIDNKVKFQMSGDDERIRIKAKSIEFELDDGSVITVKQIKDALGI
jgi:hypothetical protein